MSPRALVLVALTVGLSACPFGTAADIVANANAELLVTGLDGDEQLRLALPEVERAVAADGRGRVTFFLELPAGRYEGSLRIESADDARCAQVVIEVVEGPGRSFASVDARTAPLCAPPRDAGPADGGAEDAGLEDAGQQDAGQQDAGQQDAGRDAGPALAELTLFVETEIIIMPCLDALCDVVTTLESDGTLRLEELALAEVSGLVAPADLDAFSAAALAADADALFAGDDPDCPQGGPLDGDVLLRRVVDDADTGALDQTVDVSTCTTGTAQALRARLGLLRSLTFPP